MLFQNTNTLLFNNTTSFARAHLTENPVELTPQVLKSKQQGIQH